MNSVPVFRFSQLSIGISRSSIRHGHVRSRFRVPRPELSKSSPDLGEQIWVHNHLTSNQIIYSHTRTLDSNRAMKQLPFTGKKNKPAKLRKDYWRPMALIQFPEGQGVAGQSAFQKLREFRRLHELSWGDELLFENEDGKRRLRTRQERGRAINDQRANSIADMAAVLAGIGRGSRLWVSKKEKAALESGEKLLGKKWSPAPPAENDPSATLVEATIYWMNDQDRNYATRWSPNVTHDLLDDAMVMTKPVEEVPAAVEEPTEPAKATEKEIAKEVA